MPGSATKEPVLHSPKEVATKVQHIQELLRVYKIRIAELLDVPPVTLNRWMQYLEIPDDKFQELCKIEANAIKADREYEKSKNFDVAIPLWTKDYIDKSVGMSKYCIGEIFIRNLIDNPMKMVDLQRIAGIHRQSASRKVKQMEHVGVIECDRSGGQVVCRLRPGVRRYILENYKIG